MSTPLLTRALLANAVFSLLSGATLIAGGWWLADGFGVPFWVLLVVGAGLIPFGVGVAMAGRSPSPDQVRGIIVADLAWVIGAVVLLLGFPSAMSDAGRTTLAAVTALVGVFASLQTIGARRAWRV